MRVRRQVKYNVRTRFSLCLLGAAGSAFCSGVLGPVAWTAACGPQSARVWNGCADLAVTRHVCQAAVTGGAQDIHFRDQGLQTGARNLVFVAFVAGLLAASWYVTGMWWRLPMLFALPSMVYRLWSSRMDTQRLAELSASVDSKYVASTEEQRKQLHTFMCGGCGYTLFPARGREGAFFPDRFKCPICGAAKRDFFEMNDGIALGATSAAVEHDAVGGGS
uniref:Rubredoxin-like domain-containing protein n=1 Tax=Noctiluca scintillans TaxID=2966 RepID=A0A7S1A400_NOCSC|mmetsp:Transcript_30968/g.82271  ORF Transcript_30968/g.82271 Transcript_30968/m.82271 type:complete len:220 (+) Transcript_30968:95-754(+)